MVGRGELTEEAWSVIAPLLPAQGAAWRAVAGPSHGDQRHLMEAAHRRALARPAGALRPVADVRGPALPLAPRRDVGPDLAHVQTKSDAVGEVVWEVSIDSSTARAHQHASGARRRPQSGRRKKGVQHPTDEGLGRSRGGLTTKFHLACDGKGRRSRW